MEDLKNIKQHKRFIIIKTGINSKITLKELLECNQNLKV